MAVLGAVEVWEGRGGKGSWPNKRTYTREYQVRSNVASEASNAVVNAVGIRKGNRHPEDLYAYCVGIDARQYSEDATLWRVTYDYDSHPDIKTTEGANETDGKGDVPERPDNPLLKPPVVRYSTDHVSLPAVRDRDDRQILNSAGQQFDPPLTQERRRSVMKITMNRPTFSLATMAQYEDAVNNAPWQGNPARTVKCSGYEGQSKFENGIRYWEVGFTLVRDYKTWDVKVLDAGFYERVPAAGIVPARLVKLLDAYAQPASQPYPLNGAGRVLPVNADPVYLTFKLYPERDFTYLFF